MPPDPGARGRMPPADPTEPDPVLIVDGDGRVIEATTAAARLLGHEAARLAGVPVEVLLGPGRALGRNDGDDGASPLPPAVDVVGRRVDGTEVGLRLEVMRPDSAEATGALRIRLVEVGPRPGRERRPAALADLASRVSAAPRPEQIADIVVEHARSTLGASVVELVLIEGGHPQLLRLVGYDAKTLGEVDGRALVEEGAIGDAIRTRRPVTILSAEERHRRYPGIRRWLGDVRPRSIVCLPLVADRLVLGALALGFDEDRAFTPDELSHIEVVAHVSAQGLHRARLFDDARVAAASAMGLARLSGALARAGTARDAAGALLDELQAAVDPATASVALLDEAVGEFELVELRAADGRPTPQRRWPQDLPSPAGDVVRTGASIDIDGETYRERYPAVSAISPAERLSRYVALPLVVAGRPIGAVGLSFGRERSLELPAEHLQALVDAAAQAIARARSADAERAARRLLGAVVDQMPLGVLVLRAGSRELLYANAAFHALFATGAQGSAETQVLRLDGSVWPLDDRPFIRAVEPGEVVTDELCILERPDGSRVTIAVNAGPVRDASGAIIAGVAVYSDVTVRREAELARDAFIGILSHELRTPITSIFAGAVLLSRGVEASTAREVAAGVMDDAERLRSIVEDVLVLSRVEHGADLRRDDAVLVQRVAARVVADEQRRWPGRRFMLTMPPDVPPVVGDEGYIEHVLRNLLSNAGKYGPGDGRIDVVVERDDEEARVRVLDEGPGIPPGDEENVFTLFYRASETARRAPGAGIGLYAVRALVDGMGGRVWARGRREGGAEVGFSLRLLPPEPVA